MARILRSELPDGYFHLTGNAVHKTRLFCDGDDYRAFIALLTQGVSRWSLGLHAYCLMGTHFHALVDARIEDLSPAMQWIQSHYAREHNARFGRKGALFRQRFSWVIHDEGPLREHARVHARQPGSRRTRLSSQGLAVELRPTQKRTSVRP